MSKNENHSTDLHERRIDIGDLATQVAVLESIVSGAQKDMEELARLLKEHMIKEEQERKELMDLLATISKEQEKYKNLIGGIVLTVSAIFTVGGLLFNYLTKHP